MSQAPSPSRIRRTVRCFRPVRGMRAVVSVAAVTVLAACGSSGGGAGGSGGAGTTAAGSAANGTPIRVGYLLSSAALPALVADQQGYFTKHGLKVKLTGLANPSTGLQVLGRDLDITEGTSTDIMLAVANGRAAKILSGAYQESDKGKLFSIVAGADVASLKDLRGKKIGLPSLAGVAYYSLLHALSTAGLTASDVNIVQVAYADMAAQLKAGVIQAALDVDPFRAPVLKNPAYHSLGDPILTVADPTLIGVWDATTSWLAGHSAQRTAYIAAMTDANAWINAHEDDARAILVKTLKLPAAAAQTVVLPDWTTKASVQDLTPWLDLLATQKVAPAGRLPKATDLLSTP